MPSRPRRLLIVEESLKDFNGHWFEYDRAMREANRAEGTDVTVAGHRELIPEVAAEINAVPLFEHTYWDGIYHGASGLMKYAEVLQHNWRVFRSVDRFLASTSGGFDCVFVSSVVLHHLIGWRMLVARHRHSKLARTVLFLRTNVGKYRDAAGRPVLNRRAKMLRRALASFRDLVEQGVVCLATDSPRLAVIYERLAGVPFRVFPSPRIHPSSRPPAEKPAGAPVVMSALGPPRREKGSDVLQEAIRRVLRRDPEINASFVIHWSSVGAGLPVRPDPEVESSSKVIFRRHNLSTDEYDECVARTDCMLLPYRRESYYARISGVAVEAATAGIPMIFTRDTWIEDAVAEYGAGLAAEDGDPDDLAEKIREMVREIARFRAQARERTKLAREHHSIEEFQRCLWGV